MRVVLTGANATVGKILCRTLRRRGTATLAEIAALPAGLYHLHSNRRRSFLDIAFVLNELPGRPGKISPTEDFIYDQRLVDDNVLMKSLDERLPMLR